jgi:hypothetical protein
VTDWGKRVLLGSLLGALFGALLGFVLSRLLWSAAAIQPTPLPLPTYPGPKATSPGVDVPATTDARYDAVLNEQRANDVVLVSALYALDGDLERARERLASLGFETPEDTVADLALTYASAGNRQVATDLATLAAALGHRQSDLLAYVATATITPSPGPTEPPPATMTPTPVPSPTPTSQPSPTPSLTPSPKPTPRPPTRQPATAAPTPLPSAVATPRPLEWDLRVSLFDPPVRLVAADVAPGQPYWRLVRLKWLKASEGGNRMLYVTTFNEKGQPVWGQEVMVEHGVKEYLYTEPKSGEPYGTNYPMSGTLNSYQVYVGGDLPSERVVGLGLGEWPGGLDHTTFILEFQRATK